MTLQTLAVGEVARIPVETLRLITSLSREQQQAVKAFLDCSEETRNRVAATMAVLDSPTANEGDRRRALEDVANTLSGESSTSIDQFVKRLRNTMQVKQLTQEELALRASCSQSAISHLLNRSRRPQRSTIVKLAAALNVEPQELWPDLEVLDILDAVAIFQEERELTDTEAEAFRAAASHPPNSLPVKSLPSCKQ